MKVSFIETSDPPIDICWHNMRVTDSIYDVNMFRSAISPWFSLNPTKTYQDLEKELREKKFNMHFIASDVILSEKEYLTFPSTKMTLNNHGETPIYECLIVCHKDTLKLNKFLSSFPDNFNRLGRTGVRTILDDGITTGWDGLKEEDIVKHRENIERDSEIAYNEKKLCIKG